MFSAAQQAEGMAGWHWCPQFSLGVRGDPMVEGGYQQKSPPLETHCGVFFSFLNPGPEI